MGLNNSKKKKIIEVNNFYDELKEFECCICFNNRKSKMKRILCGHQICEKCFLKLNGNNLCPICRQTLEPIDFKNKEFLCYVDEPFQENYDYLKKEIIEQVNLHYIQREDVILIKENIGKLALIGKLEDQSMMVYFMPYYKDKKYEIINNFESNNKYLLYTLLDDLKRDNYDIWYNNKFIYDEIKYIFESIEI